MNNISREMEQENIDNTPPSLEELGVIKETLPLGGPQAILGVIPPSVEEQEVPKKNSPSVDEQEVINEIPTSKVQPVSKPVPSEVEQEVLLKESEIIQEPVDVEELEIRYVDDDSTIVLISDDDEDLDTAPVPSSIPIKLSTFKLLSYTRAQLNATQHCGNVNKLYNYAPKRYLVKKPKRRASSVPRYLKLLTEPRKPEDAITDSESDNDNDFPFEVKLKPALKPSLKRKRTLILPDNLEFENTRKTMKPGPKSKTRNIATVSEMINEAKRLGLGPSTGFADDSSEEEMSVDSDDSSDEHDSTFIIDSIVIEDSDDDVQSGTVECIIDDNETSEKNGIGNFINVENKNIHNTVSETLNNRTNETENVTEVLETAIDSNKMIVDENTKDNNEVEQKNVFNESNEPIGVGEKQ